MYYNDDVWDRVAVGKKIFIGVFCPISQFFFVFFCSIRKNNMWDRTTASYPAGKCPTTGLYCFLKSVVRSFCNFVTVL